MSAFVKVIFIYQITYSFSIDPVSGNITTNSSIDRERKDRYMHIKIIFAYKTDFSNRFDLIVTATDLDPVQPLSSIATLTLTIIDINDNNPTFSQPIYYDNDIVENTIIISIPVTATDNDVGNNSVITYSIAEGNKGSTFLISKQYAVQLCVCMTFSHCRFYNWCNQS